MSTAGERLVSLAGQLEGAASRIESEAALGREDVAALALLRREVGGGPVTPAIAVTPARPGGSGLRAGLVAAAAIIVVSLAVSLLDPGPGPALLGLGIEHRIQPLRDATRIDRFVVSARRPCTVMALLRTWDPEGRRLSWTSFEWSDGSFVARVTPGQPLTVEMDVSADPAVPQLFLLAAIPAPRQLLMTEARLQEILQRLEGDPQVTSVAAALEIVGGLLGNEVELTGREFVVQ